MSSADALPVVPPPRLCLEGLDKAFPGVVALRQARLTLHAGEVHVLMGQNGAGKSTLIKVLTGVHAPDAGRMLLDGRPIAPASPLAAQALGISTVYQEVNLCPNLSVTENILAGAMPRRLRGWGGLDWRAAHARAAALLATLRLRLDVRSRLGELPVAVQQMVAIARSVRDEARVLVLDEPTSSLDEAETAELFALMRRLKERGVAILFVTHFLDQAYAMADRFTVMRNGEFVGEYRPADLPRLALVHHMVGRDLAPPATREAAGVPGDAAGPAPDGADATPPGRPPVLEARGLARHGSVQGIDLRLRAGEVVGLAGLLGSGRTETARLLFGVDRPDRGHLLLDGREVAWHSPGDAVRAGLACCPEERKTEGIVAELSVRENIALALQAQRGWWRHLPRRRQHAIAEHYVKVLGIKAADVDVPIGLLSGGNQQKALLARWLAIEPRLLILDEPTRGIDVAAKQDIMDQVLALCRKGLAVLFISSEIPEVLRVSDRVVVMRDRRQAAELDARGLAEDEVLRTIAGQARAQVTVDSAKAWP